MELHAIDEAEITTRVLTDKMWGRETKEKILARLDKSVFEMSTNVEKAEKNKMRITQTIPDLLRQDIGSTAAGSNEMHLL